MPVRRVVTGHSPAGRSSVASDGPAPTTWCSELWATDHGDLLGTSGEHHLTGDLEPPPGGTRWRLVELAPARERSPGAPGAAQVGNDGWHRTDTLDYVVVLDGELVLELEEERVLLQPGDVVVQRATNHAWRNEGDRPVRLLAVMLSSGEESGAFRRS
jgi:mannose-6-phosphate isomerase-like protein (cupin superfamily)